MPDSSPPNPRLQRFALPLCLLAQACLLLTRLDLLPAWGDEYFTLTTAGLPLRGLIAAIAAEKNNPPLHTLLLHFWLTIPWPAAPLVAARALSALFALGATLAIDRCWLRRLDPRPRQWFLLLWTLSPCVLLYARMARSYTLQLLLFTLALHAATRLQPRSVRRTLVFAVAAACLLYTHYLPGLALVAAVVLVAALRTRQTGLLAPVLAGSALVAVAYVPWTPELWVALHRMAQAQPSAPAVVRLGYWFFSFGFGETPPLWVLAGAALLTPGILYLLWKGASRPPAWLMLIVPVAIAAYLGAGRWVSFVFVPARLLFLLPFFLLLVVNGATRSRCAGLVVLAALLCLSAGSIAGYFRQSDFLNKTYLLPYAEIASLINRRTGVEKSVLIADTWNTDPYPLAGQLRQGIPLVLVSRESTLPSLRQQVAAVDPDLVWYFRNSHDTSPGGITKRMEDELAAGRQVFPRFYVPYSRRDQIMMRLLGWPQQPSHLIQLLEMRR